MKTNNMHPLKYMFTVILCIINLSYLIGQLDFEDAVFYKDYSKDIKSNSNKEYNFLNFREFINGEFIEKYTLHKTEVYTLFIVYNSENQNSEITEINGGKSKVSISGNRIDASSSKKLNVRKSANVLVYKGKGEKKVLTKPEVTLSNIVESYNSAFISEIILFDKSLNNDRVDAIETYLCLKYGISKNDEASYIGLSGNKIISDNYQYEFPHQLSYVGYIPELNLSNSQSCNASNNGLFQVGIEALYAQQNSYKTNQFLNDFISYSDNFSNGSSHIGTDEFIDRRWRFDISKGTNILNKKFELRNKIDADIQKKLNLGFNFCVILYQDVKNEKKIACSIEDGYLVVQDQLFESFDKSLPVYLLFDHSNESKHEDESISGWSIIGPTILQKHQAHQFDITMENSSKENSKLKIVNNHGKVLQDINLLNTSYQNTNIVFPEAGSFFLIIKSINGEVLTNKKVIAI